MWLALLLASVGAAATIGWRAMRHRLYHANVRFRIIENRAVAGEGELRPPTTRDLQDYFYDAVFNKAACLRLIRRHGLYPSKVAIDPRWAVETMRDDIDVKVFRNQFLREDLDDDVSRTARLAISYASRDRETAYRVVKDLARLVRVSEHQHREHWMAMATRVAQARVDRARRQIAELKQRQTRALVLAVKARGGAAARARAQAFQLLPRVAAARDQLEHAEAAFDRVELRQQIEKRDMGMRFEQVDQYRPTPPPLSRSAELALFGVTAFLLLLPLMRFCVGVFSTRVYLLDDVQRLGLDSLAHLPRGALEPPESLRPRR